MQALTLEGGKMSRLKDFEIKFAGLKLGKYQYDYQLDNEFFELFDYREFGQSRLRADVIMEKKNNSLEFNFKLSGTVEVPCDLTLELFDLPLDSNIDLVVKFGEIYDDSQDDILTIPSGDHSVNIAQYLYEMAVLALPLKKIHPDVSSGKKNPEILEKLKNLSPENKDTEKEENKETDPRWDKLKSLLN